MWCSRYCCRRGATPPSLAVGTGLTARASCDFTAVANLDNQSCIDALCTKVSFQRKAVAKCRLLGYEHSHCMKMPRAQGPLDLHLLYNFGLLR